MGGIILVGYDRQWPAAFHREATSIRQAMRGSALRIEHVGSTSVPGLDAKPVIDIQVSVAHLAPLEPHQASLRSIGYTHVSLPPPDDPSIESINEVYPFFQKPPTWPSTHHVHLCLEGSVQERDHLIFRDYLRDHPDRASAYLEVKKRLMTTHIGDTLESRQRYSIGKTKFVDAVIRDALAAGYTGKQTIAK